MGLFGIFSPDVFNEMAIEPEFPSSVENLQFVKEMLEYLEKGSIFQRNLDIESLRHKNDILGGMSSRDLDNLGFE